MVLHIKRRIITGAVICTMATLSISTAMAQDNSGNGILHNLFFGNTFDPELAEKERQQALHAQDNNQDSEATDTLQSMQLSNTDDMEATKEVSASHHKKLCLSNVCIGDNLKDVKVQWVDMTQKRQQAVKMRNQFATGANAYTYGNYLAQTDDGYLNREIARIFPTTEPRLRGQVKEYGYPLSGMGMYDNEFTEDLTINSYILDNYSAPAFQQIDEICHPIELGGEFMSSGSSHRTIVLFLPAIDGTHKDYWRVHRIIRLFPDVKKNTPAGATLHRQIVEELGHIDGKVIVLSSRNYVNENNEANEGLTLELRSKGIPHHAIIMENKSELEARLDHDLDRQPFCHAVGNPNLE